MSVSELSPSLIATLTEKELEILRLLTTGHTVKSIAARLGRSETSINERLRDARRKTGVGSSRELARCLAAQKIWDKNFDLSSPHFETEGEVQPAVDGRNGSKGTLVMLIALPLAALGIIVAAASTNQTALPETVHSVAARQSPLVGSWSLDVARIPPKERPQSVTMDFRVSRDQQWTTHVVIVGQDGSITQAESTAELGGIAVPITGNMGFVDTVSLRQPAANTLVMTLGKDGNPVSTRVYTVSKDGRSMTETIVWASENIPKLETAYFNRVD